MKRNLLGIIALGLILSSLVGLSFGFSGSQVGMSAGVGLRAGLLLGALWMAYPQLIQLAKSFPMWMIGAAAIVVVVLVTRQFQLIPLVLVAVAALAALQFAGHFLKGKVSSRKKMRRRMDPPTQNPSP